MGEKRVILGSDHGGFELKEEVKGEIINKYRIHDCGPFSLDKKDDYPSYAFSVGREVATHPGDKGVLFCTSGIGMSIAANKVPGIRAVFVNNVKDAIHSRKDNDANILCLGKMPKSKAKKIINTWLNTEFSEEERHKRRISQIRVYES